MKRKYIKPSIVVESFQLDAAVAAACSSQNGGRAINYNPNSCGFEEGVDKQWAVFTYDTCDYNADNEFKTCYDNAGGLGNMVFMAS